MDISKAIAVVTGGASGLGHATAEKIVAAGGCVALLDVNEEMGKAAAKVLGDKATFIRCDVSDEAQVNAAVEKAHKHFGGLTLAVNCAGVIGAGRVLGREAPMEGSYFARTIQINLIGSFFVAKAAANLMQHNAPNEEGERGVIISTASIAAFEGQIGQAAYSASKGGVAAMALPMAREFARLGIRVNTIAPGIFMTPMMSGLPEEVQKSLAAQVPFPSRLGRPNEYADTVEFIYATPMINAEVIRLDGAIRMQPK
jgi:NAD(P)-dependent dehydrogenase (short-subunit alcohol dehydrogenase family)